MSEVVLDALVKLFALIGDIHDETVVSSRERSIVRNFLLRQLNQDLTEKYMRKFDDYLSLYTSDSFERGTLVDRKRVSLNSLRILGICEQINEELDHKQKVYILVQVTEYIALGDEVSDTELDFLMTIADSFNISKDEFINIRSFIMSGQDEVPDRKMVLLAGNFKDSGNTGFRHLHRDNMSGVLCFLSIKSNGLCILRYTGSDSLYLNGQLLPAGQTGFFDHGSVLRGQGIKSIYFTEVVSHFGDAVRGTKIFVDAHDVSYRFRSSENGVQHLSFHEESGSLVGILGGSGVGKSTTLSILNGSLKPQGGKVLINGYDIYDDDDRENLSGVIGFVPQDDLLIEELTVFENLWFNARMCLSNLSDEEIYAAAERMLYDFDLSDTRDLKVGNPLKKVISGGQRKRLNIALELIRQPSLLFVDEPTSGLSSVDSELVMNLLKEQTYKGKIVVVNIHQPGSDIFKMFDRIIIIDRGGHQVYYGNPNEAIVYFRKMTGHANPEEDQCVKCGNIDTDEVLRIIEARIMDEHGKPTRMRKVSPEEWAEKFRQSAPAAFGVPQRKREPVPENIFSVPGLLKQALIFLHRDILSKLADRQYLLISLLGPPLLSAMLAWFTKSPEGDAYSFSANENIPAFMFMAVITSLFFGLMLSSQEIVRDRKILKRESFLNLSWFSYLASKVTLLFFISAIQSLSFILIGNAILEIKGMTFSYWLILFATACSACMLGLIISSALSSLITIYILIPFIIIPQLLFSGVLVKFEKLHLSPLSSREYVPIIGNMMTARWSFEAMAVKQFRDNAYERNFFGYNSEESRYTYYSSYLIPRIEKDLLLLARDKDLGSNPEGTRTLTERTAIYIDRLRREVGLVDSDIENIPEKPGYSAQYHEKAVERLDTLRRIFMARRKIAGLKKDSVSRMLENTMGRDRLVELREKHDNKRLRQTVLDLDFGERTRGDGLKYICRYSPGYMKPSSPWGRAHFYAPSKFIGKTEIHTTAFNLAVIWFITLILFIILCFRIPGKITEWFSARRTAKSEI